MLTAQRLRGLICDRGRNHWVDLYTGPLTWQLRDQAGILSMIALLTRVHKTAIAVFADGEQYKADPTDPDYRAANRAQGPDQLPAGGWPGPPNEG